ncbi:peptide chain release factor N(5)-glutamine methyltransferase [Telmatobacter bradus]|uniref:peptide chain release factor N(5)-glutamine methyltransferase n=1 Tax=Telmatobacter bradus TaxID=474953 RepID=UPI003B438FC9
MTLSEWLKKAEVRLLDGPHSERARRDAEALLLHLLRRDRAWLIAHSNESLQEEARYSSLIERRLQGEPIQYITGETEFYGRVFRVHPGVLIPRPETEHLIEKTLELTPAFPAPRIVDVGSGSGAIAITLAAELPLAQISSIDISPAALAIARENAALIQVAVRFLEGDLLAPVAEEQFDFVVSNPPYVPTTDRDSLSVEVRDYEPALALFADADGLSIYRRLIPAAHKILLPGGWLLMEIGYGQSEPITALLAASGFAQICFTADLQGIPRVAVAQKRTH